MFTSTEDAWVGAVHSTKNARALYDSATLLYKQGHVGVASALLVLSAEESSKGIGIGQHITSPLPPEKLKQLFRTHLFKHQGGAHASACAHLLVSMLRDQAPDETLSHGKCGVVENIEEWRINADNLKKRGFYVDYIDGKWHSPDQLTHVDYEAAFYVAETLLTLAEGFFLRGTIEELKSHDSPNQR